MPLYTVLAPPPPAESIEPDPVAYVFVKDGLCWPFLFFAVIWPLFRRLWLVLVLYLVTVAIIAAIAGTVGGPLPVLALAFVHVFFALQANGLRRWTLGRHGYALIGVAEGRRVGDAEIRFFHDAETPRRDPRQPPPARLLAAIGAAPRGPSAESGDVVGFFPVPGGTP
jgi:hypothetical protein